MKTTYSVYRPGEATPSRGEVDWPKEPDYFQIKDLIEPLLGAGEPLEHVFIYPKGKERDMFVSEIGKLHTRWRGPFPRNEAATAIYQENWLRQHPGTDPRTLPEIVGVAVVFDRKVWF